MADFDVTERVQGGLGLPTHPYPSSTAAQVDFIAAAALAPEELERQRAAAELAAKSTW